MLKELRDDYFFECFGILDNECESVLSPVGWKWLDDVVMVMVRDDCELVLCHGIGIVIADS